MTSGLGGANGHGVHCATVTILLLHCHEQRNIRNFHRNMSTDRNLLFPILIPFDGIGRPVTHAAAGNR